MLYDTGLERFIDELRTLGDNAFVEMNSALEKLILGGKSAMYKSKPVLAQLAFDLKYDFSDRKTAVSLTIEKLNKISTDCQAKPSLYSRVLRKIRQIFDVIVSTSKASIQALIDSSRDFFEFVCSFLSHLRYFVVSSLSSTGVALYFKICI